MTEVAPVVAPAVAPGAAEQPALILGKFKTVEDLAASYTELQKTLGARAPAADPLNPPAVVGKDGLTIEKAPAPTAGNALQAAYSKATSEAGLVEADYAALAAQGFDKATIDSYVEGRKAVFASTQSSIYSTAGDKAGYQSMVQWAAANLPPAEVEAYNATMKSGNVPSMTLAVQGLVARFRAKVGTEPATLDTSRPAAFSAEAPFTTRSEYYKITGSREYRTDPAVRAKADARLKATMTANPNF
ncbi:capsid assembly protein [uncultured Caudovirales phage]|uniref:Capsid assembly protein n=1 Tax=uncultured Caudovirales phage TaxID=2100421 RepID=A0A6J5P254_9CAUD|nr:capsid assembly protein [uncultured Caudovirales phage]